MLKGPLSGLISCWSFGCCLAKQVFEETQKSWSAKASPLTSCNVLDIAWWNFFGLYANSMPRSKKLKDTRGSFCCIGPGDFCFESIWDMSIQTPSSHPISDFRWRHDCSPFVAPQNSFQWEVPQQTAINTPFGVEHHPTYSLYKWTTIQVWGNGFAE